MPKQIPRKPFVGKLAELLFGAELAEEQWCVKVLGDKVMKFPIGSGGRIIFNSEKRAKNALVDHIYGNYCQGHYWHKGKDNTFAHEGGWNRNGGDVAKSRKEFKEFAKQTTEWLLDNRYFTIEKVNL